MLEHGFQSSKEATLILRMSDAGWDVVCANAAFVIQTGAALTHHGQKRACHPAPF